MLRKIKFDYKQVRYSLFGQTFSNGDPAWMKNVDITDPEIIIDIGANIGVFTLNMVHEFGPETTILAIEPEPTNYELLSHRTRKFDNVITVHAAVSDINGNINLHVHPNDTGAHSIIDGYFQNLSNHRKEKKHTKEHEIIEVDTYTLDSLIRKYNFESIDFIKIDAEGAAPKILKCAEKTLERTTNLIIEANHPGEDGSLTKNEVMKFMSKYNFDVHTKNNYVYATKD